MKDEIGYKYFISYYFNRDEKFGFGRCFVTLENPVTGLERDFRVIDDLIAECNPSITDIIILSMYRVE